MYEDILLRRDMITDEIVGVTILYARSEALKRTAELKELNYDIDILQLINNTN